MRNMNMANKHSNLLRAPAWKEAAAIEKELPGGVSA